MNLPILREAQYAARRSVGEAKRCVASETPESFHDSACPTGAVANGDWGWEYKSEFPICCPFFAGKKRAGLFKPATFFIIEFILQNCEVRGSLELQFALVLFLPLGYDARVENTAFFEIGT